MKPALLVLLMLLSPRDTAATTFDGDCRGGFALNCPHERELVGTLSGCFFSIDPASPPAACLVDSSEPSTTLFTVYVDASNAPTLPLARIQAARIYAVAADAAVPDPVELAEAAADDPAAQALARHTDAAANDLARRTEENPSLLMELGTALIPHGEAESTTVGGKGRVSQRHHWPSELGPGEYIIMAILPPASDAQGCTMPRDWQRTHPSRVVVGALDPKERAKAAHRNGMYLYVSGQPDLAIPELLRAAALDSSLLQARLAAAELLLERGDQVQATAEAQAVLLALSSVEVTQSVLMLRGEATEILRQAGVAP